MVGVAIVVVGEVTSVQRVHEMLWSNKKNGSVNQFQYLDKLWWIIFYDLEGKLCPTDFALAKFFYMGASTDRLRNIPAQDRLMRARLELPPIPLPKNLAEFTFMFVGFLDIFCFKKKVEVT